MDVLTNLRTFLAVARHGGFSEAARQLHVVPSVAAKRVSQLETTMRVKLFERSTRQIKLTAAGSELQIRAAGLIAGFDELAHSLKPEEGLLQGAIRLMAPTTLTTRYLGSVLNDFMREHERITLEIALVDRSINPIEEGFDLAISGRSASYDGVIDVPLCPVNAKLCVSPDYLQVHGTPTHPRELADHRCLVFKPAGVHWQFQSNRGLISVDIVPKLVADDNQTLLHAVRAGQGIAILPNYVVSGALHTHELIHLMPRYSLPMTWFKAYVPLRKHKVPRVKALVEWIQLHMRRLEDR